MRRPSFATVLALLALVVAMSGTAYAVYPLDHNSVRSWHISNETVQSKDVRNGTLRGRDMAADTIPQELAINVHSTTGGPIAPGQSVRLRVYCPADSNALAGGVLGDREHPELTKVTASNPIPLAPKSAPADYPGAVLYGWEGGFVNTDSGSTPGIEPTVWVVCTNGLGGRRPPAFSE